MSILQSFGGGIFKESGGDRFKKIRNKHNKNNVPKWKRIDWNFDGTVTKKNKVTGETRVYQYGRRIK